MTDLAVEMSEGAARAAREVFRAMGHEPEATHIKSGSTTTVYCTRCSGSITTTVGTYDVKHRWHPANAKCVSPTR